MVTELDIYRAARVLVREHGADSPIATAMHYDALLDAGDLDGAAVWKRILAAIDVLLDKQPRNGRALQ